MNDKYADSIIKPHRLFAGKYPAGIVYADRHCEKHGDYKKLAFLSYATLELEFYGSIPAELKREIKEDAATLQARAGESYQISTCGQAIILGYSLNQE